MLKAIFSSIDRNKNKILKFLILCSAIKFIFSLLYRICSNKDSRTQFESMINIYSLFLIGLVLIQEFLSCFVPNMIQDNFKVIRHNRGKGIIFILISMIYMSPTLDDQQHYSAYCLFSVGILLLVLNRGEIPSVTQIKKVPVEIHKGLSVQKSEFSQVESKGTENDDKNVNIWVERCDNGMESKKTANPYDIPDDF